MPSTTLEQLVGHCVDVPVEHCFEKPVKTFELYFLKSISIYKGQEENQLRAYMSCVSEKNPGEKFSVILFLTQTKNKWRKLHSETDLDTFFNILNNKLPVPAKFTKSEEYEGLFEGDFILG